jgi:uncharacterized membrane protein YedE/YeeE
MQDKRMNPYMAGVGLGLTLLASFLILGAGLGASGGLARMGAYAELYAAKTHTLTSEYFGKWGETPLEYYLVFMIVGVFVGAIISVVGANRFTVQLERAAGYSAAKRVGLALAGGILVGFASRLANGCTSGQALTGGALLMTGSWVFLVCIFAGGYAAARFVRRQWND